MTTTTAPVPAGDLAGPLTAARASVRAGPPVGAPPYAQFAAAIGRVLRERWEAVAAANADDIAAGTARQLPEVLLDQIRLRPAHLGRLTELAADIEAAVPGLATWPAGTGAAAVAAGPVTARRVPRPLGVVAFIYEARPTVTIEGALLAGCAGNAVLLRGGREISQTNRCFATLLADALAEAGLPAGLVQVLEDPSRDLFRELLTRHDAVDVLVPRGSPSLIEYCRSRSSIPVLASGGGVNHLYVDASADPSQAALLVLDSKLPEPTACNTVEMILAHRRVAADLVAALLAAGRQHGPYTMRLAAELMVPGTPGARVEPLGEHDDGREFLDRVVAVRPVDGVDAAAAHIRRFGSAHTDGIISADPAAVARFIGLVDAAAVVVNGSLRLHDGPTMGLGPELSISTGRLHVRGPVRIESMLTYSWVIDGRGTLRGGLSGQAAEHPA